MKLVNSIIYIAFVFITVSCTFEEANIFPDTSAIRIEKTKKEYNNVLCSSSNGWVMEYFPNPTTEGYTFLVKFNTSGSAEIAGKNQYLGNKFTTDTCLFQMIADDGPVLTFNSYGKKGVLHLFANPKDPAGTTSMDGIGLGGDYEFIVIKATQSEVKLKGKKWGSYVYLHKLADNQSWTQYFDLLDNMNDFLFKTTNNILNLIVNKDTLPSYYGTTHIFRIIKTGEDPLIDGANYPFIVTTTGLRLYSPYILNDFNMQNFVLSVDKKQLVSAENPAAYFTGPVLNKYLYSDLSLWKADAIQMTDNFKSAIKTLGDALIVKYLGKRNFEYIAVTNKAIYANSILIRVTGVDALYRILFSPVSGTTDRIMISLPLDNTNLYDNNGKKFYTEVPAIKTTLDAFCGEYVVTSELPLNVKSVKYTRVDNPSQYFVVNR